MKASEVRKPEATAYIPVTLVNDLRHFTSIDPATPVVAKLPNGKVITIPYGWLQDEERERRVPTRTKASDGQG